VSAGAGERSGAGTVAAPGAALSRGSVIARPDGAAIVWCQGAFNTPNGKTAHGLVRRTARYRVLSVIDAAHAGRDAAEVLDGTARGIPVHATLAQAVAAARAAGTPATHFVVGLAPDGGRLPPEGRADVVAAIRSGLAVDCGLHDYLNADPELAALAREHGVTLRDVRRPPPKSELHFFSGKIEQVTALKIAVLGTDSAVGKRTTAWVLVDALEAAGFPARLVGTGQTAWMQGVKHGMILDTCVNDFLAGEIEHAVWSAWNDGHPRAIVIEGQGSLMNPAYPGGYELLAAGRPACVVMQHAPTRKEYDGFPGYAMHPLEKQIAAIEMISSAKVVAVTLNHEGLAPADVPAACADITRRTGLPCCDALLHGVGPVVDALRSWLER
jgi:uncharacterized NAD-dependent epimerase/dehydratase family protein